VLPFLVECSKTSGSGCSHRCDKKHVSCKPKMLYVPCVHTTVKNWSMTDDWVDWFPTVFFPLKVLVLGVGMFFAQVDEQPIPPGRESGGNRMCAAA